MRARFLMAALLLSCSSIANTQEGADLSGVAGSSKTVDYGPAFERLVKLGLPDAKGASYVNLTMHASAQRGEYDYYGGYERYSVPKRDGNAWLLPNEKDGMSVLIHKYFEHVTVVKKKKRGGLMRALIGKDKAPQGAGAVGDWKTADVAKDAAKIIRGLDAMADAGKIFDPSRWKYDTSAAQMASKVLVIACHMYRAGHTKEGNQLAQKILSLSPNPMQVIDGIVSELAEQQYQILADAFFKNRDWKAYHTGLTALTERYPRGWKGRLGAQILLPKIEQRVKGEKATMADFKGITLKPEAVKILDSLLARTEPIVVRPTPFWLIVKPTKKPSSADGEYDDGKKAPAEEWMMKLCAMGMDGFVALAAASADETLIATSIQGGVSSSYSHTYMMRSMMRSRDSLDVQAMAAYAAMERPCTRGEIARQILISTMPDADDDLNEKSPEDLRDIAYQWWLAHRADSKSTLARHIMETGDDDDRQVAVRALIASGKDADAKLIEEYIMSAESLSVSIVMLEPYLKSRRGKAREFFKNYSKMLNDMVANGDQDSLPWNLRKDEAVPNFLKRLSVYVDDISPEKVLADIKSGKTSVKEGVTMLDAAMGDGGMMKLLPTLVSMATKREKVTEQVEILQKLVTIVYTDYEKIDEDEEDAYFKKLSASMLASKDDWEKLLARTEKPASDEDLLALNSLPSLAVYSAWAIEMIYFPHNTQTLQQINSVLGREKMSEFIMNRAKQLMADPSTADFPDPSKVDEARGKEIREALTNLPSLEIVAYYEKLQLFEKLAWTEVLAGYEGKMPAGVAGLSKLVVNVNWSNAPKADAAYRTQITALVKNKELNKELVDNVIAALAKDAELHASRMFLIQSMGQAGTGMTLQVWSGPRAQGWKDGMIAEGAKLLNEGKAESLAGVSTYIDGDWLAGMRYLPSKDAPDDSTKIKKIIETIQTNISNNTRFNLVFFAETSAHMRKREKEAEDEEE